MHDLRRRRPTELPLAHEGPEVKGEYLWAEGGIDPLQSPPDNHGVVLWPATAVV